MKAATLILALGALAGLVAPALANGCCATARLAVTVQGSAITIRDTRDGVSWTSADLGGAVVEHAHGASACRATVADLDGDANPEVVVTVKDGDESGLVYVFGRKAGEQAFVPLMCEVGPGVQPRAFLVWDIPSRTAPVAVTADGAVVVTGRQFSLLGEGTGRAEYTWKLSGGMLRHTGVKPLGREQASAR